MKIQINKNNFFSKCVIFMLAFGLVFFAASCSKKSQSPKPANFLYQNQKDSKPKNQNLSKPSFCLVKFTNKTENKITSIVFCERGKSPVFNTVSLEKDASISFEFPKNVPYTVELVDEKNHRYCKKNSDGSKYDSYFSFDTDSIEIEFTDKDFVPENLKDFAMKFFGL